MHIDNYYSDHRVRARDKWYIHLDEKKMIATVRIYGADEDEDLEVPFFFQACSTCDGRGVHVNPSVDCNGLTADDFAEDPDFAEDYFSGKYDVPCYNCRGRRVEPVLDRERADPAIVERIDEYQRARAEHAAERAAERRMGA